MPWIPSTEQDPIPDPGFQQIDWFHLALPFMFHVLCCGIALLVFMIQTVIAICKYGYGTVLSSYCYYSGVRRQAASRAGQGRVTEEREVTEDTMDIEDNVDTLDMEDNVDQLVQGKDMEGSRKEAAARNTDHDEAVVLDIE